MSLLRHRPGSSRTVLLMAMGALAACEKEAPPTTSRTAAVPTWRASLGPIGVNGAAGALEHIGLIVETPLDRVAAESSCDSRPAWHLSGLDPATLEAALRSTSLAQPAVQRLVAASACDPSGCELTPPPELLASLSARERTALYSIVLRNPVDARRVVLLRRARDDTALWTDSRLSHAAQRAIDELTVELGDDALMPDPIVLCERLPDLDERVRAMRTLLRTRAERLRLSVPAPEAIDSLARYWGRGGREDEVHALLTGLSAERKGGAFDVLYLLPPFARSRLLTFPGPERPLPDCHASTLHFDDPGAAVPPLSTDAIKARFETGYEETPPSQLTFGDVVMLSSSTLLGEQNVHSAVYIADGVVFTKNGVSPSIPWTLSRLDDVVAAYRFTANRVHFLRRKTARH